MYCDGARDGTITKTVNAKVGGRPVDYVTKQTVNLVTLFSDPRVQLETLANFITPP